MTADRRLSIAMIASEAVPFAKTGGLGDVLGALPPALAGLGHGVTVFVPRYRGVAAGTPVAELDVSVGASVLRARFERHDLAPGLRAILVVADPLYDREGLYGIGNLDYPDNALRFAFLASASLAFLARANEHLDIVHGHDWQAGLAPIYLKRLYSAHPLLARAATVLTIHNLSYQGLFPADTLPALGLGWDLFAVDALEYWGKISFLKGGINFSQLLTTVSPSYAREIQTPEFGFGFDGILRRRAADLSGILNGIDVDQWNPMTDPALPAPFGPDDLSRKRESKRALLKAYGMAADEPAMTRPVVGLVSRMVDQKGFDLLSTVLPELFRLDAAYVLLGSGDPRYEEEWRTAAANWPGRVGARIGFDERLAHLVEAGADLFLMPSRFEPCGLNQMYSLRYGTVPVVRATGGLDDTIEDYRPRDGSGTGFKFKGYTGPALIRALRRALEVYRSPDRWHRLQRAGMQQDHSWNASAREYVKVYERALGRPGRSAGR